MISENPIQEEVSINYDQIVQNEFKSLMKLLRNRSWADQRNIKKAFEYAKKAHEGVRRKSGEPYILHPLAVATILVEEMSIDDPITVMCAFMHDVVEDTSIELSDINRSFGEVCEHIIDGLTKISGTEIIAQMDSRQAENFRKIFLTISNDIRVVLIKLADRLHNMRTLGAMRKEKVLKIASETLFLYAPLAHRLGLYQVKNELEDLSLKHSEPLIYRQIHQKLSLYQSDAEAYISKFIKSIENQLKPTGLKFKVKSRFKTVFSVWKKMERKGLPFEEIYDLFAIRIILESKSSREREDCWKVYSVISGLYRSSPKRLRDWITVPKENGYESLHTTLLGPDNHWVEVQIRTKRMDEVAEKGIAAHWQYKDSNEKQDAFLSEWIDRVREILENEELNALDAVKEFKENLEPNDLFLFTPKGELVRLPAKATVLDFAYKIHSDIGFTAIGAKVNNEVVTLQHILSPGDQIEILTSKKQKPKRDWLRIVKTERARESIKIQLRKLRKDALQKGRRLFEWRARQYGVTEEHPYMKELLAYFSEPTVDEFFIALGEHRIDTRKISEFIQLKKEGKEIEGHYFSSWELKRKAFEDRLKESGVESDRLVLGVDEDFENYILSKCCEPLPGDDIFGFKRDGKIFIHRTSCSKGKSLMSSYGPSIVRAEWADHQEGIAFLTALKIVGLDKQGMLNDIIKIISLRMKLNIRKVIIASHRGMFEGQFSFFVSNKEEVAAVMDRLESLPHIYSVSRLENDTQSEVPAENPLLE